MTNEYLSDARFEELQKTLAKAMTPVCLSGHPGYSERFHETLESAYDNAAYILASIGIMPKSTRADCEVA